MFTIDNIPYESALLGNDQSYESYLNGMIEELNRAVGKGADVVFEGPMESRIFLDFLHEALRRYYINKLEKTENNS